MTCTFLLFEEITYSDSKDIEVHHKLSITINSKMIHEIPTSVVLIFSSLKGD